MKRDFTKSVRNVSLNEDRKSNHIGRDLSVGVELDYSDKIQLKSYMLQELKYYNALTAGLSSRCRTFPETLLAMHDDWMKVFAQIAYSSTPMNTLYRAAPDSELSKELEPYRKFLVGNDAKGKRFLSETMYSIMELAATTAYIHPLVRRNIATSILRFYKEQAAKAVVKGSGDNVYRSSPEMLPVRDIEEKRHLQIPKSTLSSMIWDEEDDCTIVGYCYSERPLRIPHIDLTQNNHWNLIILHQESDTHVTPSSNWFVDIKKSEQAYLIKYIDNINPKTGQAFAVGKSRSF